jgi:serine/threonine protein kinase
MALKVAKRYADCADEYKGQTTQQQHCLIMECGMRREALALHLCRSWSCICVVKCFARGKVLTSNGEELPCLLLELAPCGSLEDVVRPGNIPVGMPPIPARRVLQQIIYNLYKIHDHNVIHRDVKCSNVLLFGPPSSPAARLKLADFGSARIINALDDLAHTWFAGTPVLRPPEMREGARHDSRADTFMLGLLLLEVRYGYTPFWYLLHPPLAGISPEEWKERFETLYIEILRDDCPYNVDNLTPGWVRLHVVEMKFVHACLQRDCAQRPSAAELLDSEYFNCI